MGRRGAWHVHEQRTGGAQIRVYVVEREPIYGYPVICRRSAKDWSGLEADHCFAAAPVVASARGVPCSNERVHAIASHAADAPYRAATGAGVGGRGPCCYGGWIIDRHAYQP